MHCITNPARINDRSTLYVPGVALAPTKADPQIIALELSHNFYFYYFSNCITALLKYKNIVRVLLVLQHNTKFRPVFCTQPTGFVQNTGIASSALRALDAIQRLNFVLCFSTNTPRSIFIVLDLNNGSTPPIGDN